MPELGVAVLGATGVVGSELVELLAETGWVQSLVPLASPASKTPQVTFRGSAHKVLNPSADALEGVQVIFSAAPRGKQKALLEEAAKAGAPASVHGAWWLQVPNAYPAARRHQHLQPLAPAPAPARKMGNAANLISVHEHARLC